MKVVSPPKHMQPTKHQDIGGFSCATQHPMQPTNHNLGRAKTAYAAYQHTGQTAYQV
jgi:hypothetical protein